MLKFWPIALLNILLFVSSCKNNPAETPIQVSKNLLALHGLTGRHPDSRSNELKNKEIPVNELLDYFLDYQNYDKFVANLYVGVVLGALATNQSDLAEQVKKEIAQVSAGTLEIIFAKNENKWKIVLDQTIPQKIKKQAQIEYDEYKAAAATAQQALP